jgi:hypothetical protein
MDGARFDRMTRTFAGRTRRSVLKAGVGALLGGAAGGLGLGRASAALQRAPGDICRKNGDCASGLCGPKDRTGRQRCLCVTPTDCPATDACTLQTCTAGVCGTSPRDCAAEVADQCNDAACDPLTGCYAVPLTGNACDDGNICTTDNVCTAEGACVGTPVICTASDDCHVAGICDSGGAACSNSPTAPHGTPCDDGNPLCIGGACCTDGHEAINGLCFTITTNASDVTTCLAPCSDQCSDCFGSVVGSGNYVCAGGFTEQSCASHDDCPAGSACQLDGLCIQPC